MACTDQLLFKARNECIGTKSKREIFSVSARKRFPIQISNKIDGKKVAERGRLSRFLFVFCNKCTSLLKFYLNLLFRFLTDAAAL